MQEAARRARRGPGGQGSLSPVSASLSATRTRTPPRRRKLIFCALSTCRMAVSLCEQRGSEGREHGACRARPRQPRLPGAQEGTRAHTDVQVSPWTGGHSAVGGRGPLWLGEPFRHRRFREARSPLTGCGSRLCPWGQATAWLQGGDPGPGTSRGGLPRLCPEGRPEPPGDDRAVALSLHG